MEKLNDVKAFLFHDVAFVAECLEPVKTVVIACAAHADSAEWNFQILNLDNGVVDASRA